MRSHITIINNYIHLTAPSRSLRTSSRYLGVSGSLLPPNTSEHTPTLTPSQIGWYSIYLSRRDGRLSWPRYWVTYRDGLPVSRQSPIQVVTGPDVEQLSWSRPSTTPRRTSAFHACAFYTAHICCLCYVFVWWTLVAWFHNKDDDDSSIRMGWLLRLVMWATLVQRPLGREEYFESEGAPTWESDWGPDGCVTPVDDYDDDDDDEWRHTVLTWVDAHKDSTNEKHHRCLGSDTRAWQRRANEHEDVTEQYAPLPAVHIHSFIHIRLINMLTERNV